MVDFVIQATGTLEVEDGFCMKGSQSKLRNDFQVVCTLYEINTSINPVGSLGQVPS